MRVSRPLTWASAAKATAAATTHLYDTYEHYTRFRDPGFAYGRALADLAGTATLRLANAPVLPFRFGGLADNLSHYLTELEKLADDERENAARTNRLLREGSFDLALGSQQNADAASSRRHRFPTSTSRR